MSKCHQLCTIVFVFLLTQAISISQVCATCAGDAAYKKITLFGAQGVCAYVPQAEVDIHTATNPSARWAYGQCANAPRSAGFVGLAATAGFLTGLSGTNDFLMVANDTCRHLRIANNSALENSGNVCFDLTQTAGTQVNRMTLWRDGKIDFNVGNWNCQKGMIRFEGESWDGSSGNVDDPVMKLYRPTGTSTTCPDPTSYTWWIQNAGASGSDYGGALQFRALPTSGTIGSETVSTMETRVTFLRNGNVGINTTTPIAKLQVHDGAVMFDGTTGSTPTSGAGTRMMWIPAKSSIRAGEAVGSEWDATNIANFSFGLGKNVTIDGSHSFASGEILTVSGGHSAAIGFDNTVLSDFSIALGQYNSVASSATYDNSCSFVSGRQCSVANSSFASICMGDTNTTLIPHSIAMGWSNVSGKSGDPLGNHGSVTIGHADTATETDAFAIGHANYADGDYAFAIGEYVKSRSQNAMAIGSFLDAANGRAMLLGCGYNDGHRLTSTGVRLVQIGVAAEVPTITVIEDPNGPNHGTFEPWLDPGNVGIGDVAPSSKLQVAGGVVVGRSWTGSTVPSSVSDDNVYVQNNVTIASTGSNAYNLYVEGTTYCTAGVWTACDTSLKRNVSSSNYGLDAIRKIKTVSYQLKSSVCKDSDQVYLGVIAQDLANIIPCAVRIDTQRYDKVIKESEVVVDTVVKPGDTAHKELRISRTPREIESTYKSRYSVNTDGILYAAVNGLKELDSSTNSAIQTMQSTLAKQDSTIEYLKQENKRLQLTIQDALSRIGGATSGSNDYESTIILEQNRPNPFSGSTEIVYWIEPSVEGEVVLEVTKVATNSTVYSRPATKGIAMTETIDATGWEKGVYIYCLRSQDRIYVCKKMLIAT